MLTEINAVGTAAKMTLQYFIRVVNSYNFFLHVVFELQERVLSSK
jgi:hypothetical protein